MIKSTLAPSILHIEQHSSRIMTVRLKTQPPTRIIVVYMPQAFGATWEQKSNHYDALNAAMDKCPKKETLLIMGDFNARLQFRPRDEQAYIGPWVYGRGAAYASDVCEKRVKTGNFS